MPHPASGPEPYSYAGQPKLENERDACKSFQQLLKDNEREVRIIDASPSCRLFV
jgi:hypothetical protein